VDDDRTKAVDAFAIAMTTDSVQSAEAALAGLSGFADRIDEALKHLRQASVPNLRRIARDAESGRSQLYQLVTQKNAILLSSAELKAALTKVTNSVQGLTEHVAEQARQDLSGAIAKVRQESHLQFVVVMTACSVVAILLLAAAWTIRRLIVLPLVNLNQAMRSISAGDYTFSASGGNRGDEIGDMSRELDTFRERLRERDAMAQSRYAEAAVKAQQQATQEEAIAAFRASIEHSLRAVSEASDRMAGLGKRFTSRSRRCLRSGRSRCGSYRAIVAIYFSHRCRSFLSWPDGQKRVKKR
jgi:methyl-accepting chemotaxis protein